MNQSTKSESPSKPVTTRPILFSGQMVRAILERRKTQTRRIVKPQPPNHAIEVFDWRAPDIAEAAKANEGCYYNDMDGLHFHCKCPYGTVGTHLWIRETWGHCCDYDGQVILGPHRKALYRADDDLVPSKWRPSIHMPRWASRITLEITAIRVERLNDISAEDAKAEGISNVFDAAFLDKASSVEAACYATLWESINGKGSWEQNPWVWVVEFEVMQASEERR